jgi:pyridoxine 4-dehydrogenase
MWVTRNGRAAGATLLRRVLELGVNLIDTADIYERGESESLIAEALFPYPEDLIIATKGGQVWRGGGPAPDGRPEHLRSACEHSLRRLRVDTIDLYQLHNPDPKVPFEESLGALADLRAEGKVRQIGISNFSGRALFTGRGAVPIVSLQNQYNLMDRRSEAALEECERQGVAFIPYRPLASGHLASSSPPLASIGSDHGATAAQVALAWLLQRSPVVVPIPGTASIEHLEENVAAARLRLSADDVSLLDAAFATSGGRGPIQL